MARALSDRLAAENQATLLALQLLFLGPLLAPLLWWGVRWLRRHPAGQPFRSLLWAWPISLVATFATGTTPHDIANEVHGAPIVVCRGLQTTWERLWPLLRHLS